MPTFTEYHRLIRESRKLGREFDAAYIARNEEAMAKIAFRQMDVDAELERYTKLLAQQGANLSRRRAA